MFETLDQQNEFYLHYNYLKLQIFSLELGNDCVSNLHTNPMMVRSFIKFTRYKIPPGMCHVSLVT